MRVKININPTLRSYTDNVDVVQVDGDTVGQCLEELIILFPRLREVLFNKDGKLVTRWGSQGSPDEIYNGEKCLFVTPHAIAVDSHGDIYVGEIRHKMANVDRGYRALQKFVRRK